MSLLILLACTQMNGTEAPAPQASAKAKAEAEAEAEPKANQPDMVIVAVAGVRGAPDAAASTAFLAPFADQPMLSFSSAYAVSPNTYVSLATLLAGRYPSAIPFCGLTKPTGSELPADAPWCNHWPTDIPSLPMVLSLYGYRTALVAANVQGVAEFSKQFQNTTITQEYGTNAQTDWPLLTQKARDWWQEDTSHPRLLVVVTSDLMIRQRPDLLAATGLDQMTFDRPPPPLDPEKVNGAFNGAIAEAGHSARALVDALPGSERARYTIAMGLHGMNLGDAAVAWQALRDQPWNDLLLDRTLRVPLAIMGPVPEPHQESQIVEVVDILPTLLTLAGAVLPANIPGQNLLSVPFATDPEATAYGEFGDMLSVRKGPILYSVRAFFDNRSSLDPELTNFIRSYNGRAQNYYLNDLSQDPLQRNNLLQAQPDLALKFNALLLHLRTGVAAPAPNAMDARKIWDLRMSPSVGYW